MLGMLMLGRLRVNVPSLIKVACAVRWALHRSHLQNSEPITSKTVSVGFLVKLIRTTIMSVAMDFPQGNISANRDEILQRVPDCGASSYFRIQKR